MNQRLLPTGYLLTGYFLAGLLLAGIFATPADGAQSAKPNIVLIVADDLGYRELGSFGQQRIRTPQLDRLARQGMRLTQHYAGNAVCAPSRCVLMTGKHPGHATIRTNRSIKPEGQEPILDSEITLAECLRAQGYVTGAFGKWGLGGPGTEGEPLQQGFDRFFGYNSQSHAHSYYPSYLWSDDQRIGLNNDPPVPGHASLVQGADPHDPLSYAPFKGQDYAPDRINRQALAFLRANKDRPFFLYYPTILPHVALHVPDEDLKPYLALGWQETPFTRAKGHGYTPHLTPRAAYAAMITRMDRYVGNVLVLLDELGLADNTIVIFSSDNGTTHLEQEVDAKFFHSVGELRGLKGSLYEGGVRVPTIVRWPGQVAAGSTNDRVTGFEDWLPTLLDLIGAGPAMPKSIDGISMAPTLRGRSQPERPFLYREFPSYGGQQSIRVGDWKAIRQKMNHGNLKIELYDLATDVGEQHDVAAEHPDIVARLQALMDRAHTPSKLFPLKSLDGPPEGPTKQPTGVLPNTSSTGKPPATATQLGLETAAVGKSPAELGHSATDPDITATDPRAAADREGRLLQHTRQLTFQGRRAGEGYFSPDGTQMVFQSEREADNPFFQIYRMDLETGDLERLSTGTGKTTCAWIHPTGKRVLFASTHEDPHAVEKQQAELKRRATGQTKRYAWDYDEHFDIYQYDLAAKTYTNLTHTKGYDAEGSWSPDSKLIAFTSNRRGFQGALSPEERKLFEQDPATLNDIYIMRADGTGVRRLTTASGYDGGPFFSPDGQRIVWRRFTPNGASAEIWTMNVDGSDPRQITRLAALSWAPFYHPSGEYLIFTTNQHGFSNFELYLADVAGRAEPVRVTYTAGFDGLPVFTPDGRRLAWTTNRTPSDRSQIFLADWNHTRARQLLGLEPTKPTGPEPSTETTASKSTASETGVTETGTARAAAWDSYQLAVADYAAEDIRRHVAYLCRPELAGRMTGTPGEQLATAYVAAYFQRLGLQPAGDQGGWFQSFQFTSGVALEENNRLASGTQPYRLNDDWRPLSFSGTGQFKPAPLVFAGYGMDVPVGESQDAYDSYTHLDVRDKWVLAFRYLPENISAERRQHLARGSQLRFKATVARDHGARGLILVTGPNAKANSELVPLRLDGILAGTSLPVISVTNRVAEGWLAQGGKSLQTLQDSLDQGEPILGFTIPQAELSATIGIRRVQSTGRNVLGRLQAGDRPAKQLIVCGAHIDHLGTGVSGSSLARDAEEGQIHFGADDNASGVAAMLEIAHHLADQQGQGKLPLQRDILLAAWSGEELGLLGSDHFVRALAHLDPSANPAGGSIYPAVAACLNMDMVGRLEKRLILQGVGSSSLWPAEIEQRNVPVGLPLVLQEDSYLPTDAKSFYVHGVPVLSAFTGSHAQYHTPRDTPDRLNYEGAAAVARLLGLITRSLGCRDAPPDYLEQAARQEQPRGMLRAYLGTIPDYAQEVEGVLLSGVRREGPAARAGVRGGDIIVELAGKKIENIYDYTHAIEGLKIEQPVKMAVRRGKERVVLEVVPGARE